MIAIVNISKRYSKTKRQCYVVKINRTAICEFTHFPPDGLAICLEKAAKAVKESPSGENLDIALIVELLGKE